MEKKGEKKRGGVRRLKLNYSWCADWLTGLTKKLKQKVDAFTLRRKKARIHCAHVFLFVIWVPELPGARSPDKTSYDQ